MNRKRQPYRAIARILLGCLVAVRCIGLSPATAAAAQSPILWGVAESGLEIGRGMKPGINYSIPDPTYYLRHNVRLIRLPFQISRAQPKPQAPLAPAFISVMKTIVRLDQNHGAVTVLDPHGYGFYNIEGRPTDLLKDPAAAADYIDLMRQIAVAFAHDNVAIGLMNEPHTGSDIAYSAIWNRAIAAIRAVGFTGTILVPHAHWSNAADISLEHPFTGHIVDPLHNWVLELHLYLDPDSTGTYRQPIANAEIGWQRLSGAIAWSQQSGIKIFLGETGAPPDSLGMSALHVVLTEVAAAPDAFWGITLWGAGGWWRPDYPMRLDPVKSLARPQFVALENTFRP
jgi:endoglucanase